MIQTAKQVTTAASESAAVLASMKRKMGLFTTQLVYGLLQRDE